MAFEFTVPDFLKENNPEDIHARMMHNLPEDIDTMPGGFPYDFTMPTALEKSELIQFHMVRTLMLMFPQYAWGEWLDLHGQQAGVFRKEAGCAMGEVTFEGIAGTRIPAQRVVCTAADDVSPSIEFTVTKEGVIPESGVLRLPVVAVVPGIAGNVAAGTITLFSRPLGGVTRIRNEEAVTGGTEAEDDETFRERILERNESKDTSFVGNNGDYIRWAKELVGVGSASAIPEWDGPGTVKLVILDSNGMAANEVLLQKVYDYIMAPDRPMERKAPIGAVLTVTAPEKVILNYTCRISLVGDTTPDKVREEFETRLERYYLKAREEGVLRYTKAASLLSATDGVEDYSEFLINGGTDNILLRQEDYPVTGSVLFTAGEGGNG